MKETADKAIDSIFKINLGVKTTEKVIVFTDGHNEELREIGRRVAEAGREFTPDIKYVEYLSTGCHGVEPPEEIWAEAYGINTYNDLKQKGLFKPLLTKQLTEGHIHEIEEIVAAHKKEAVNAVIALSNFSTSHTRFRVMLNEICGSRYASMPLFDAPMLSGAMSVNWQEMAERTGKIAEMVNKYENIEINTPNGTAISFSKKGRDAKEDTGIITGSGQFSNLPAGEVYLAPLEGTANGKLVIEWAPTRRLKSPLTLHIDKGQLTKIEGEEEYADFLQAKMSESNKNRNIAELGIGTNNRASRPDNILESEKISGTIHIALGDNSSFGGTVRTSFHQDFVFFEPTVTLVSRSGHKTTLLSRGSIFNT